MKLSPETRSRIMSAIRSRGNASTELRVATLLRKAGLSGWRRHQDLPGHPDFVFKSRRLAIFVDGCFWHGCARCSSTPRQNTHYWQPKLDRNRARDKEVSRTLRAAGWNVVRVWEHELQNPTRVLRRLASKLQ